MSGWFRFYADALDDPKVQKLEPDVFKLWVNLLCYAKKCDGVISSLDDVSFALRAEKDTVSSAFHYLESVGLIDTYRDGWEMHNWRKRQYKSDTSTERVKRFRKRFSNVTETPPDTDTDTDTDTETENTDTEGDFLIRGNGKEEGHHRSSLLKTATLEAAKKIAPGYDIYFIENSWRTWTVKNDSAPRNPDRAFLGFVKKHVASNRL